MRLVRTLLRYFPIGLAAICSLQVELSRYFLMHHFFEPRRVLDVGSDLLFIPFPNSFFLTAVEFAPGNSSWYYFYMGLIFVLVIGPIALVAGMVLARISTSWSRALIAAVLYFVVSLASFAAVVRIAFG